MTVRVPCMVALCLAVFSQQPAMAVPAKPTEGKKAALKAPESVLIKAIASHAVPIDMAQATFDPRLAIALTTALGQARIVGLGEASHGSSELFILKHRLVAFMVEQLGFRVFAIEGEQTAAAAIDQFLAVVSRRVV